MCYKKRTCLMLPASLMAVKSSAIFYRKLWPQSTRINLSTSLCDILLVLVSHHTRPLLHNIVSNRFEFKFHGEEFEAKLN